MGLQGFGFVGLVRGFKGLQGLQGLQGFAGFFPGAFLDTGERAERRVPSRGGSKSRYVQELTQLFERHKAGVSGKCSLPWAPDPAQHCLLPKSPADKSP